MADKTKKIYITRTIPDIGITMLREKGYDIDMNMLDRPLTHAELVEKLRAKPYDAVLSLLTDTIDRDVYDAAPAAKIFANFAIGFNNFDVEEGKRRGITLTNTPGGGADRVAEHTWALILALTCRVVEADRFVREGKYSGWDPMLFQGTKLAGQTLGLVGTGRIGANVAHRAVNGFMMKVVYYDVIRNEKLEKETGAVFCSSVDDVLKVADIVSIHVPLLDSTKHLINAERLTMMKPTAFLVNTSRGPVVDEIALVEALKLGQKTAGAQGIRGAGLDVFEFEPKLAPGLAELSNVVLTPHIASSTEESRNDMATIAATNIIEVLEGRPARNMVYN